MLTVEILSLVAIIVAPVILLVFAVIIAENDNMPTSSKQGWLLVGLIACLAVVIRWVAMPNQERYGPAFFVLVFLAPIVFTVLGMLLVWRGLRRARISAPSLIAGLISLVVAYLCLGYLASIERIGIIQAILGGACPGVMVLIFAEWLFVSLPYRRRVALLVGILLPLSLVSSIAFGDYMSPDWVTERNGAQIVQALNAYYSAERTYALALTDLVPKYMPMVPDALTTHGTGWMYMSTEDNFTLGYWLAPYKMGALVCLYSSREPGRMCDDNNWGPFRFVGTPTPSRDNGTTLH